MTQQGDVRELREAETDSAARLLARAFHDNPGMVWGLPRPHRRPAQLEWIMRLMVRAGLRYGHVEAFGEPATAISVWYPPEKAKLSLVEMLRVGFLAGPFSLGIRDFSTMVRAMTMMERKHAEAAPAPHYYLHVLGVEPSCQRQGHGSRLMQSALAKAATGSRWYLETDKPEDVQFYQVHGFSVRDKFPLCDVGPTIYAMQRP